MTSNPALRRKYRQERDKPLRPDGNDQYQYLPQTGPFARYLDDPYTPRTGRAPKTDHRTSASSKRAATSAGPGTGTAIRASSATRHR